MFLSPVLPAWTCPEARMRGWTGQHLQWLDTSTRGFERTNIKFSIWWKLRLQSRKPQLSGTFVLIQHHLTWRKTLSGEESPQPQSGNGPHIRRISQRHHKKRLKTSKPPFLSPSSKHFTLEAGRSTWRTRLRWILRVEHWLHWKPRINVPWKGASLIIVG